MKRSRQIFKYLLFTMAMVFLTGLFYSEFANANESPKFGEVDMIVLYVFHPETVRYSTEHRAFFRSLNPGETIESRVQNNLDKISKLTEEINQLYDQSRQIYNQQRKLEAEYQRIRQKVSAQYREATLNLEDAKDVDVGRFERQLNALDKKHQIEIDELQVKIDQCHDDAAELNQQLKYINYLDEEEQRQLTDSIHNEIKQAIEKVQRRRNLAAVFNSSRQFGFPQAKKDFVFYRPHRPDQDNDNFNLFEDAVEGVISEEYNYGREHLGMLLDNFRISFQIWYNDRYQLLRPFIAEIPGKFVIGGTEDITAEVLKEILSARKVGEMTINFLIMVYEKGELYRDPLIDKIWD